MKTRRWARWVPLTLMSSAVMLTIAYLYARSTPANLNYNVQTVGQEIQCIMDGQKVLDPEPPIYPPNPPEPDPGPEPVQNHVEATFRVEAATSVGSEHPRAELSPILLTATGTIDLYGAITYTLDPTRPATPTTVAAINESQEFPARVDIYIPVEATIAAHPEARYRSIGEIHLVSISANSFNPFNGNDRFRLAEPVSFEDINAPNIVAFTVNDVDMN